MAYVIPAGSTLELQVVGNLDGQVTRTVFHYWLPTGSEAILDGAAAAAAIGQEFADGPYQNIVLAQSNQWNLLYIQTQWVLPQRYRAVQQTATTLACPPAGQVEGDCLPSGCAARVSCFGQQSGRQYQGGHWFPGIPESHVAFSLLTVDARVLWDNVAADMDSTLTDGVGAEVYPVTVGKGIPGATNRIVTQAVAKDQVRYQRRREVGKGE